MNFSAKDAPCIDGSVDYLRVKSVHGLVPNATPHATSVLCVQHLGIEGDVHANRLSPRQILITLASDLEEFALAPGALHENMVISLPSREHFRPGAAIVTSSGVEIRLTMYCEPCARILPLVANLRRIIHRRGILGTIVAGGAIRIADTVQLLPDRYAPLPESPVERFLDFVSTIPAGKVVRYSDVAIGMGVADSFVRALPGYIRRNLGDGAPVHRIVNAKGELLASIPDQAQRLAAEGVRIDDGGSMPRKAATVDLATHLWRG